MLFLLENTTNNCKEKPMVYVKYSCLWVAAVFMGYWVDRTLHKKSAKTAPPAKLQVDILNNRAFLHHYHFKWQYN